MNKDDNKSLTKEDPNASLKAEIAKLEKWLPKISTIVESIRRKAASQLPGLFKEKLLKLEDECKIEF